MKHEAFDVARALAGEPVILRNGFKAYIRHREEEFEINYPLTGVVLEDSSRVIGESWILSGSVYLSYGTNGYDIVGMYPKEPLTMPDSFWDMLTPEIVAIAKDADGEWYGFKGPPMLHDNGVWGDGSFHYHLETYPQEIFPDCEPRDSLIMRPTK